MDVVDPCSSKRKFADVDPIESCNEIENKLSDADDSSEYDYFCDSRALRSGLLSSRLRPCSVPRARLSRYYHMLLEQTNYSAKFEGIPEGLKPFMYAHQQYGWGEGWLCSIFRHLPPELLKSVQTAAVAVAVLVGVRLHQAKANIDRSTSYSSDIACEDSEPWLYQGLGLSDYELETFHNADFGIAR